MIVLRALLFPFSVLYDLVTLFRNHLYDIGHKKSFQFDTMVISVGNLNVGGSGKTPMIEHLAKLLLPSYKVAMLSRGYGRKTRGLRFATESDSASTIGDEPYQFYRKFGADAFVAVGEDRAFAIPHILQRIPAREVILLDDAFQHRAVKPQLSILLTEFASPFYCDYLMPTGNLRERRSGAKRSDIIVVTKCPMSQAVPSEIEKVEKRIHRYAPGVPVFFTGLDYGNPVSFGSDSEASQEIILVTGIANCAPLLEYAGSRFTLLRHFSFRDHHRYSMADILSITAFHDQLGRQVSILTTEKDMVKLIDPQFKHLISASPWFYLPIRISFINNGSYFDKMVLRTAEEVKQRI